LQARLYQGATKTAMTLDVRKDTPVMSVNENLSGVNFGPLLTDLMQDDYVSGIANVNASLQTRGTTVEALKQNLNGKAAFDFREGEVKYLDVTDILLKDYAKYIRMAVPEDQPEKTTAFKELRGSATIANGVVSNKDLFLLSSRFQIKGAGKVDLPREKLDYTINTEIINATDSMKKIDLDKLQGHPIPVHFRGTFSQPDYNVDWEAPLKAVAKQRLKEEEAKLKKEAEEKVEKEKRKLEEKAKKETQEELDKLKDKLKDRFKKLF
jgi:AsmA protein